MQQGPRVDPEPAATAHDVHAVDDLLGRGPVVGRAEHPDAQAGGREAFGDALHVTF